MQESTRHGHWLILYPSGFFAIEGGQLLIVLAGIPAKRDHAGLEPTQHIGVCVAGNLRLDEAPVSFLQRIRQINPQGAASLLETLLRLSPVTLTIRRTRTRP